MALLFNFSLVHAKCPGMCGLCNPDNTTTAYVIPLPEAQILLEEQW